MMKLLPATVIVLFALAAGSRGEELYQEHSVLPQPKVGPSASPPSSIPYRDPASWRASRIYLAEYSTYDLHEARFQLFLPDSPKAILFQVRATPLGWDQNFYYFRDAMFDHEWAFGREPADDFLAGHAIWSRPSGQTTWDLRTGDAVVASPPPNLPAPRERSVVTTLKIPTQSRATPPPREPPQTRRERAAAMNQSRERNRSAERNDPRAERVGVLFPRRRNPERGR